ncbi:MAG: ABC transporter ATP-binding protein [Actinobacteria bacterium]|nr:ABC transporter ATP-binding protein [Actinomycetota bacterium]
MSGPAALSVRALSVSYAVGSSRLRAVAGASLDLPVGHRMAIVGESGSGKSTLGLAVMGLLPPSCDYGAESVTVGGDDVAILDDRAMRAIRGRRIAMVFQDAKASLDPVRTIGSQIAEVLRAHAVVPRQEERAEVERLLAEVEIKNPSYVAGLFPHELSGGMRQRAMIAVALAGRPEVLIADEPTSALDVTTQAAVVDLLVRLGSSGSMSTVLITHDLALVAGFAETVTVMYAGEIVETGPVERVYSSPSHPYTRALLGSIPSIGSERMGRLGSIAGTLPDLTSPLPGCAFEPRCAVGHGRERCRTESPGRTGDAGGGFVACHFPGEIVSSDAVPVSAPTRRAASSGPLVETVGVTKVFRRGGGGVRRGRTVALDGVAVSVAEGESLGIVGESGSGKTTLARVLLGLERKDGGAIAFRGADGAMVEGEHLPTGFAQMVFQDPSDSLNPLMSLQDLIAEPIVLTRGGRSAAYRADVERLLADVGLQPTMIDRRPMELSGGQRQRVAIARALSTSPRVIVADEAVASLDMSARGQILNLLGELRERTNLTYVHISHDLSMVRHVCDRVVVMYAGRIVEVAAVDDLFASPRHPYTRALISSVPIPDPRVESARSRVILRSEAADGAPHDGGCAFRTRCPIAESRCAEEVPALAGPAGHVAACHFADSVSERMGSGRPVRGA